VYSGETGSQFSGARSEFEVSGLKLKVLGLRPADPADRKPWSWVTYTHPSFS